MKASGLFILSTLLTSYVSNALVIPNFENLETVFALNKEQEEFTAPDINNLDTYSLWPHLPYFMKPMVDTDKLQEKITTEQLNSSAWDLYNISKKSIGKYGHPTRVIGSPGHWASINYILSVLNKHRDYYDVSLQEFDAISGKVKSFELNYEDGSKVPTAKPFSLTPPVKEFTGELVHIPNLGCDDADFVSDIHGGKGAKIALVSRGQCPFGDKSQLAGKHGFKAVVIYDNVEEDDGLNGTLGSPNNHTVATIGVSKKVGEKLIASIAASKNNYSLTFAVDSYVDTIKTKNVIADTKHGDPDNIIALGAHSDGVEAGPGINDDGSGTISLLTVAEHLTSFKIKNKVRFAWWSAEEEGLLGSTYYVDQLTPEENSKLRLFMDYDMMASPNYQYQVYDANNKVNPNGSEELKNLYIDYYTSHGLNYSLIPFDGRSDYVAFIENGIPGGGIATGAEGVNTDNGKILDKCYHSLCDDVSNLAFDAFLTNTKLIAHSIATYARSLDGFPEREINNETIASLSAVNHQSQFKYRGPSMVM
ncbi:probable Aminopeptidase Y [Saccharomycodes ludwigii]|uniref:Peptide hydrolase n=1 Tax=Saccharomycodes ludwigii TaxID=36035 RepID=A0A376B165_9ASCO|nr:hypothetical protein SCDLUD_003585 [Saccharomycodes ludwigii]KAH3900593.1 hypothetical protein SCDLUD_003585 [Saccharomycodes ludwigii]SSD58428.1 probable Aminopeptidase Y [Saccharomycodes ludwigii]